MSSNEEDSADELYKLTQKALFVNLPTRPIGLDTIPMDGSEFIHKSRLENATLLSHQLGGIPVKRAEENEEKLMRQWARKEAAEFSRYGLKLTSNRHRIFLRNKFPRKLDFPANGPKFIQDWCEFCLGSKLCSKIYGKKYVEPITGIEGRLPVLSIIVHFDQYTAFIVLNHLHEWFLTLGMEESLGRWVYAVLACIKKPLGRKFENTIETFYKNCKKRLKDCDELERSRLYLISAIFEYYFCINSKNIGPTLASFLNLKI